MLNNIQIWLPGYIKQKLQRPLSAESKPLHIIFCIADHFEPRVGKVGVEKEIERVDRWIKGYTELINAHKDCEGMPPKYTFFYPIDEYTPAVLEKISVFFKKGLGEVEIQLHHENDSRDSLKEKLEYAKELFCRYGLLSRDKNGEGIRYGFIHGNWALDNSRADGKWCGVNNELEALRETGCYADFTLPSAPSDTQTAKINSLYYAKDTPGPKSHNTGIDVEKGREPCGDLMIIQGPLALNWKRKKFGVFPRIENSGISFNNPPTPDRIDLWINQNIAVKGRPEWIFVKVYAHGARDQHLLDEYFQNLDSMFTYLETKYNDGANYSLHYTTAREMYNIIKAAEAGEKRQPGEYRAYLLETNIRLVNREKIAAAVS